MGFVVVEDEKDLPALFEAGLLWYRYDDEPDTPEEYQQEDKINWMTANEACAEAYVKGWRERSAAHRSRKWEAYVLVED